MRKKGSKDFFFEKKKQKTFVNLGLRQSNQHGSSYQKFFASFF